MAFLSCKQNKQKVLHLTSRRHSGGASATSLTCYNGNNACIIRITNSSKKWAVIIHYGPYIFRCRIESPFLEFLICFNSEHKRMPDLDCIKDVQKLTTYFGCDYLNFEKKNMLTVVSGGHF